LRRPDERLSPRAADKRKPVAAQAELMTEARNAPMAPIAGQTERAAELRRVKAAATLTLAASLALMIFAKLMAGKHPVFGFLAAFAEAATIGGLADWYAVVALFRRPLGLPIPHTAIIPNNQHRIADKLGEFVESHFLDAAPIEARLRQTDFASFIADWLVDRKRSADLARFALRLLPEAIAAAESSGLRTFVGRRIQTQLQSVDIAPLATATLRSFVQAGRHQGLLDDLMGAVHEALNKPETLAAMREKIRAELPTLLKLYRADAFLLKRIAAAASAFFEEVRTAPDHPFRGEFDRLTLSLIDRMESDPSFASRLDEVKNAVLTRPELGDLIANLWANVRAFIDRNASGESFILQRHFAKLFSEAGAQLADDPEMRAEINNGVVVILSSFIAKHKGGVSTFIADQVKVWDMRQLTELIETNVGKDLQYIRFNGALIGGLAGLLLYTGEVLLRLL
jgi:uncharacterized membrane-anchored protein YjiN (DUF445 family)